MLSRALLLVFMLSFLLAACEEDDSPTAPADTTAPTLQSITPADLASGVFVSTNVVIVASEALDPATVNSSSVQLRSASASVATVTSTNGATITVDPVDALAFNTTYTVEVTTAVTDAAGNALESGTTTTFTTQLEPDTTGPTLAGVSPSSGSTDNSIETNVVMTFSEALAPGSVSSTTINLSGPSGAVAGSLSLDVAGTVVTFDPSVALEYDTAYTLFIGAGVTDLAGNPGNGGSSTTFRTELRPVDGVYTGTYTCGGTTAGLSLSIVEVNGNISAYFNFFENETSPNWPCGSFLMTGQRSGNNLTLDGNEWVYNDAGYITVDLIGDLTATTFAGTVQVDPGGSSCTNFSVTRQDLTSPPANPVAGPDMTGIWTGTYTCAGSTASLALSVVDENGALTAYYHFFESEAEPDWPCGGFMMTGSRSGSSFSLDGGEWIYNPGTFVTVDLNGTATATTLSGSVVAGPGGASCTTFSLTRRAP